MRLIVFCAIAICLGGVGGCGNSPQKSNDQVASKSTPTSPKSPAQPQSPAPSPAQTPAQAPVQSPPQSSPQSSPATVASGDALPTTCSAAQAAQVQVLLALDRSCASVTDCEFTDVDIPYSCHASRPLRKGAISDAAQEKIAAANSTVEQLCGVSTQPCVEGSPGSASQHLACAANVCTAVYGTAP